MFDIKCDVCGGPLTMQLGGQVAVCNNCKMQYSTERIKEKIQQFKSTNKIDTADEFMDIRDGVLVKYSGRAKSLTLPTTITKIGEYAFCGGLERLRNPYNNVDLQQITIPGNVEEIGQSAFKYCNALKQVNLSSGLYAISTGAFDGCRELSSINLPDTLRYIGDRAFSQTGIVEITFPESVVYIGAYAFSNCIKLESIKINSQNINIVNSAFSYCKSLKKAILPESFRSSTSKIFCEHRFDEDYDSYDGFCSALDSIYIGNELVLPTTQYRDIILNCLYGSGVHSKFCDILEVYIMEKKCPYCGGNVKKHLLSTYYCEQCGKNLGKHLPQHIMQVFHITKEGSIIKKS